MNKVASYLNEHILGEAVASKAMRRRMSRDNSVLTITPELVVFPRSTNDIRKVARFAWQLAEKGHAISITPRGFGADTTGASIGKGIIIDLSVSLNKTLLIAAKDRLVHVQPGAALSTVQEALRWQGLSITGVPDDQCHTSVGGAIAGNVAGADGYLADAISKIEVILSNGDTIETGRIDRKEVNKRLGMQTFEGEIYRKLSGLLDDNEELIERLSQDPVRDSTGYKAIASVRRKDGSMDLTPLFIGSQGTLGIISEVVLRADFYSQQSIEFVITPHSTQQSRDLVDQILRLEPSALRVIDEHFVTALSAHGKRLALIGDADPQGAMIYGAFNDFSDRARMHKLKKLRKVLTKAGVGFVDSENRDAAEFVQFVEATASHNRIADEATITIPLIDGAFVPADRREEFEEQMEELSLKQHVDLPYTLNVLTGTYTVFPHLKLDVVSEKQKIFRLMTSYAELVHKYNGAFTSDGAEGRLKANAAWSVLDEDEVALYNGVRDIFDPFKTMNPGVKQTNDVRSLVAALRTSYDGTDFLS